LKSVHASCTFGEVSNTVKVVDEIAPGDRVERISKDYLAGTRGRVLQIAEVVKRRGAARMRIRVQWDDGSRTWLALDLRGKTWQRLDGRGDPCT
jgi:hypothetical protein